MNSPDLINGLFELGGALSICLHIREVWRDRGHAGISFNAASFMACWGLWNLFYYPHLGQWLSFVGGVALVVVNIAWLASMIYLGKK